MVHPFSASEKLETEKPDSKTNEGQNFLLPIRWEAEEVVFYLFGNRVARRKL